MRLLSIILVLFISVVLFSCAGTVEDYHFRCNLNGEEFNSTEIPLVALSNGTMTINAYTDSSRIQISTNYQGTDLFYTGSDTTSTALIQFWPEKDQLTNYYSSSDSPVQGEVNITRLTSSSMAGTFFGTVSLTGFPDIAITNGEFFGQRP